VIVVNEKQKQEVGIKWKEGGQKGNNKEGLKSYKRPPHALEPRKRVSVAVAKSCWLTVMVHLLQPLRYFSERKKIIRLTPSSIPQLVSKKKGYLLVYVSPFTFYPPPFLCSCQEATVAKEREIWNPATPHFLKFFKWEFPCLILFLFLFESRSWPPLPRFSCPVSFAISYLKAAEIFG
jgi:hypothetical protein